MSRHSAAGVDTGGVAMAHGTPLGGVGTASGDVDGVVDVDDLDLQSAGVVVGEGLAGHVAYELRS